MPRQYTPRVHLICAQCGGDFDVAASRGAVARFCSRECFGASCVIVHEQKRCSRCGETKSVADFYPYPSRHTGAVTTYCRPCTSLVAQGWRARNPERSAEQSQGWRRRYPERARVVMRTISLVQNALRRGDLIRPEACEECGESGRSITAAHADYSRPLDVRWLCRPCHGRWDQAQPKTSPEALAAVAASWIPWAGTSRPGEQHHGAKLTEADVLLMRSLYAQGGTTQRELAGRFGIHPTLVSRIVLRKSWKHI